MYSKKLNHGHNVIWEITLIFIRNPFIAGRHDQDCQPLKSSNIEDW